MLINNGGANYDVEISSGAMTIREAFNASWDTNVSGTQVLTTGAIPLLLKSSDPRLMFITSGTSALTETEGGNTPNLKRINASPAAGWPKEKGLNPITSYRSSKCGLNMLMREWHRILGNDRVKVWCISPGFLATGLASIGVEQLKKVSEVESVHVSTTDGSRWEHLILLWAGTSSRMLLRDSVTKTLVRFFGKTNFSRGSLNSFGLWNLSCPSIRISLLVLYFHHTPVHEPLK